MAAEGVPKHPASYRDLLRAQADGEDVPEDKLRIFRREEDIIRSAVESPRAFQACGLEAAMFEAADYRIAWEAIQRAADQMVGDGSLPPENVLAEMRRSGEARFGGMAGKLWWITIESEKPVEIGYALEVLVPEVSSRFQLRLWNQRFRALGDRIDQEPSILGLYEEYVSESYRVGIAPDGGRLGRTMEEIAGTPPKKSDIVPTGIPQIDAATGGGIGVGELMVVGGGTNCIAGDMLVPINRAKIGRKMPLKRIVHMFNGGKPRGGRSWNLSIPTMVRAPFPDGTVRLARILSASASGVRPVFELKTAYASVTATAEHRVLTPTGWRRLEELHVGDEVLLDICITGRGSKATMSAELRASLKKPKKLKQDARPEMSCPHHPFANRRKRTGRRTMVETVQTHRLIAEARLNNMSLEDFMSALRWSAEGLKFLDPKEYDVHHKDRNKQNNDPDNLQVLTPREHARVHEEEWTEHITTKLTASPVTSIMPAGEQETFDLEVEGASAFIAGGVAVHNSGKSYMVQRLARNQPKAGNPVLCISAEDPEKLLACRMIADYTLEKGFIPSSPISIRKRLEFGMASGRSPGAADPAIVQAAIAAMTTEQNGRVYSYEAKKWTVSKICGLIRRHRYMAGVRMVIVDYLQAVQPDVPGHNRTQEVSEILMKLKKCATECGVALVVMSQYARDEYRDGQEPSITACKYAGDIENEAEVMCLMWRDEDDNLHCKLPKIKWVKARDFRYIIPTHPDTGNFLDWNDDFAPREPAEDKPAKRGGKRGQP